MKKLIGLIVLLLIAASCTSSRLVSYKPSHKCSVYNDVTPLHERQDIPRSLRNDYKPYK